MKTTVIYHSADFDGLFCREIARHFLGDGTSGTGNEVEYIGWDHGNAKLPFPEEGAVYVLDLSPDCFAGEADLLNEKWGRLVWIDHHKSAINKWPAEFPGYRIDGVAACRLAWFYFAALERYKAQTATADFAWFQFHYPMASKQDFIDRTVSEPLAVRLAGEYDIWDRRDPNAEVFQFGLRSRELGEKEWTALLTPGHTLLALDLVRHGKMLQRYQQQTDAGVMARSFLVVFEGLTFLALNTARCNSLTFAAKDVPETGHDALLGFYFNGTHWNYALYHARHRTELDLSEIAVRYGGGGHRGACGFRSEGWLLNGPNIHPFAHN